MDIKYIKPIIDSIVKVLTEIGVSDIKRGKIVSKQTMNVNLDVTSVIGLTGDIGGNIALSLSIDTTKKIVSAMMFGAPVDSVDSLGRSAIGELANMVAGSASILFKNAGINMNLTPPSIVFGTDIMFVISSVDTIAIDIDTSAGKIELNIGLEV